MIEGLRRLRIPHGPGAPLFFFTTRDELRTADPFAHEWRDDNGRAVRLIRLARSALNSPPYVQSDRPVIFLTCRLTAPPVFAASVFMKLK